MPHAIEMKKHKAKKKDLPSENESEYGQLFGSDENFAFIAGFTSGGAPFGITHEEMKRIEIDEKESSTKVTKEY